MKKLLLADGTNIMFRSYYGIRPFMTKTGLYTNAVYGTITTLQSKIDELAPDAVAVAFDLPSPTFRHTMYDAYKGTRSKAPPELTEQIPYVRRASDAIGARIVDCEGFEADDVLGTLADRGERDGWDVYVLTGDRDSLQLITDKTKLLFITNKGSVLYDKDEFYKNYGTTPPHLVDIKALMGDSSDNIPGVPGVGEKTALKLIAEAGSIDKIYSDLDALSVTPSVREKLRAGKELAYMSYELATIRRDAPVTVTLDELAYSGPDRDALGELCSELEFHKLAERYGLHTSAVGKRIDPAPDAVPLTADAASAVVSNGAPAVYVVGETVYTASGGDVFSSPIDSGETRTIFSVPVACHDYKSLYALMKQHGVNVSCAFDTMLAAYVLRAGDTSYELARVAMTYLGENDSPERGEDAAKLILRLHEAMKKEFDRVDKEAEEAGEAPASRVLYDIEIPLAPVLADMEEVGFHIDVDGLRRYTESLRDAENALAERIYMLAGHEFNLNSPKQLGEVLFDELGIPAGKKTKRGYSTDADTLERLRDDYDIVEYVLHYRQISKLRSTYGEGLAAVADEHHRIHTSFKQTVTATGRLSSTEPNLQNIPVRTELGRELRRFFDTPDDDRVLVDADYSQIELRLLASISGDTVMQDAFLRGADIHAATAAQVFGVPEGAVTKELRSRAKAVNFGIVYGIGDYSLSRDIGTSRKVAAEYIANYLATYRGVDEYLKSTVAMAHERGFVTTLLGRRRYIPEISASNRVTRSFGERVAMNSPIQGTAADIIKIAMINTSRALRESGLDAHLILQVHDELIVECKKDDADRVSELLRECMESASSLPVPLSVDVERGKTWFECK